MKTRIFIGCKLNPELKSKARTLHSYSLELVSFEGKDFLGKGVETSEVSLKKMQEKATEIIELLQIQFPEQLFERSTLLVFPQILLG